VINWRTTAAFS